MFGYKILDSKWVVFCLLAVVIFAVFGRVVWFDYVQLDEGIILANNWSFVSDISNFFEVFKHDINYPSNVAPYYRPMFIVSFMLNAQFGKLMAGQFGSSPMVFHIGSILLHIVAAYFVFWLFMELGFKKESEVGPQGPSRGPTSRLTAVIFSLFFAVHPAVTPVVAWVPGRIEAILTIFTILSLIMFMRFLRTAEWRYLAGFFASFTIALLTKETVLVLIPILFLYYLISRKEKLMTSDVQRTSDVNRRRKLMWLVGLAIIITAWFFVRKTVLAGANVVDVTFWQMLSMLWSNSAAIILYLGKTILPFDMSVFPTLNDSTLLYGYAALVVLAIIVGFTMSRGRTSLFLRSDRVPKEWDSHSENLKIQAMGLLWFLGFLVPSLIGLYPTGKMVFFEHRLYLPLIGVMMFFVGGGRNIEISKYRYLLPVAGIIVLFSVLAFNYSGFYRDRLTFWEKAAADSPTSSQSQKGLATAYLAADRTDEANERFAKSLELNPQEKGIHLLLGLYYLDQGRYDKGREELEKEIEIDPFQFIAYHGLGRVYAQRGNYKEAEKYFLKTVEINPDYVLARQDLVVLYFSQNKHPQAIVQFKELLRIQRPEAMHPQILKILEIYAEEAALQMKF